MRGLDSTQLANDWWFSGEPMGLMEVDLMWFMIVAIQDSETYFVGHLRLRSDNDRRPKRCCSIAVLCASFTCRQIVKTHVIKKEGPNAHDQIEFCASIHS